MHEEDAGLSGCLIDYGIIGGHGGAHIRVAPITAVYNPSAAIFLSSYSKLTSLR